MCAYDEAKGGFYGFNVDLVPILLKTAGINDTFEIRKSADNLVQSKCDKFTELNARMYQFRLTLSPRSLTDAQVVWRPYNAAKQICRYFLLYPRRTLLEEHIKPLQCIPAAYSYS